MMFALSNSDEPFRTASLRDNRGIPTLLSPWEYLEDYGIVHPSGCETCTSYMKHVADASYSSHQPAFQIAFQDRRRTREDLYSKGILEGVRRQKEDERELVDEIERFRVERNQAREELFSLRAQVESTRAECDRLQDKLKQALAPVPDSFVAAEALPAVPVSVVSKSSSNDEHVPSMGGPEPPRPLEPLSVDPSVDHGSTVGLTLALSPQHASPPMTTPASPRAQLPDCVAARSFAAVLSTGQPTVDDDPVAHPMSDESNLTQNWQFAVTHKPAKAPKSIKQIQSLIRAAHQPGNYHALTKVKALCSEAHRTPREHKTEVQRYLLSTWRTPDWEHPTSVPKIPAPMNNPRLEDPVEVWVAYYAANPSSCPKGVRREADGRPNVNDMRASRRVARLRPQVHPNDPDSREARQKFMAVVTELFSEPGGYENILRRGAFSVSPHIDFAPYIGAAEGITKESVARHFAACGVTMTVADYELGPWAQQYIRDVYC